MGNERQSSSKTKKNGRSSKSKSAKSKKSNKSAGKQAKGAHNHGHRHGHHHGHRQHGPTVGSKVRSNLTRLNKAGSKGRNPTTNGKATFAIATGKFVLKGKAMPTPKDGLISPSRLLPDQMTTIYSVPNDLFRTEKEVCTFNGYELLDQIGKGGFAVVYKARNLKTGELVACKTVKVEDQDAVLEMKNELFIMEMVDNPFAIRLYLHYLVNSTLYIFMQLADAGSFGKLLEKGGALDEAESQYYFAQMCCGVLHMHQRSIAHRDIKPANFLMANHQSGKKVVLVSDYGLSRLVHREADGGPMRYTTQCGTPAYMAPEVIAGKRYDCFLADVWSLGVTLYAMLNMMTPFNVDTDDEGVKSMMDGEWEWMVDEMRDTPSEDLDSLANAMLDPDPDSRMPLPKVVAHRWLAAQYDKVQKMQPARGSTAKK